MDLLQLIIAANLGSSEKHGREIRVQCRVPPKILWEKESPVRMLLLIFQENHMDQGGRKLTNVLQPVPVRRLNSQREGVDSARGVAAIVVFCRNSAIVHCDAIQ